MCGHSENVTSVAYSPDGTKIISGSRDWSIKIWDDKEVENFIPKEDFNNNYDCNYRDYDYDNYENERTYGRYAGSYAQDVEGWSDQDIDEVLDGDPNAYWNID